MKIGIITFTYGQNYGNKLQNYALKKILHDKYGPEVYTLKTFDNLLNKRNIKNIIKHMVFVKKYIAISKKQSIFDKFSDNYLNYYPIDFIPENFSLFYDFDILICGSDQIWNPYYSRQFKVFTANIGGGVKRISYAASIGVSEIPKELEKEYIDNLKTMDYIGVRENDAKILIERLIHKNVHIQIDPTMLINKEDWISFSKKPEKQIPGKFVLTYFLRDEPKNVRNLINNYAQKNNADIINLNDKNELKWYSLSPEEFIWMIHNSYTVFSDSFHATVFSIIMHKQFYVFHKKTLEEENKQESRIYTLLNYFGLSKFIVENENFIEEDVKYDRTDEILNSLKKQSLEDLFYSINLVVNKN